MRHPITLFLLYFICKDAVAQVPVKMSYQAVVRNAANALVVNSPVKMRISILQGSASGTAVYTELHNPTTNANGLASIELGNGNSQNGSMANIDWSKGPYFIRTETDPANETNYSIVGTSQLLGVPYAMYAGSVNTSLSSTGDTLSIGSKRYVITGIKDVSTPVSNTDISKGLIAYYPFTGNTADSSGSSLNGSLNQGTFVQDRFSNLNSALSLNGISERVEFPINTAYNTTNFTVCFWTFPRSYNIHNKIQLGIVGSSLRWSFNWSQSNVYYYPMQCLGTYGESSNNFSLGVPLNEWSFLVFVVEGTKTRFYKNGVLQGEKNEASALSCFLNDMVLCLGGDIGGGIIEYYNGIFDDVRIYNRAITFEEVAFLYK